MSHKKILRMNGLLSNKNYRKTELHVFRIRKRKKSESSGDEGWQRPDKCSKCSEVFSHDPFKWIKHNKDINIKSHNVELPFNKCLKKYLKFIYFIH